MSGLVKLTPPEPERDAAVPVIVEENTVKPRKSSLMHHSDNPGPDKLVTPGGSPKGALRKKSVGFRPSSSFEVHVEKAEDAADGEDEAEANFQSVKLEEEDEDEEDAPTITARPPTPPRGRKSLVEKSDNAK